MDLIFMFCACHIFRWITRLTALLIPDSDDLRAIGFYYISISCLGITKTTEFITNALAYGVLAIFVTSVLNFIHG